MWTVGVRSVGKKDKSEGRRRKKFSGTEKAWVLFLKAIELVKGRRREAENLASSVFLMFLTCTGLFVGGMS